MKPKAFMALVTNIVILITMVAQGQTIEAVNAATKTIVVPNDYPTLTQAIENAEEGSTILVKEGTYQGPTNQTITITKTLIIIGETPEKTIINLYPAYNISYILYQPFYNLSDAISINAPNCKLLNLTITITPGGYVKSNGNNTEISGVNITSTRTESEITITSSHCNVTNNAVRTSIRLNGTQNQAVGNAAFNIYSGGSSNIIKDNLCHFLGLSYAVNNTVLNNTVGPGTREHSGIDLTWSTHNLLSKNNVSGYIYAIRLWCSLGNTIVANTLNDSLVASINFGNSSNNSIFLNNFVNNAFERTPYIQDSYNPNYTLFFPTMTSSVNLWDNGSEGNYWDRYNGSDVNGDEIGDVPYILDANNTDYYPLMEPVVVSGVNEKPTPTTTQTPLTTTTTPITSPSPTIAEFPPWIIPLLITVGASSIALASFRTRGNKK